jgi:hypothetical protein
MYRTLRHNRGSNCMHEFGGSEDDTYAERIRINTVFFWLEGLVTCITKSKGCRFPHKPKVMQSPHSVIHLP